MTIAATDGITSWMALTSAQRQARYMARLKERAGPTRPDVDAVMRASVAARERITELEAKLARAEHKLAKVGRK